MADADILRQVRHRIEELDSEMKEIADRWTELNNQLIRYQNFLEVYGEVNPATMTDGGEAPIIGELLGHSVADAAQIVMERSGGQAMITHLIDLFQKAQIVKSEKRQVAYGTIMKTLGRYPDRFYKVRKGVWGLEKYRASGQQAPGRTA